MKIHTFGVKINQNMSDIEAGDMLLKNMNQPSIIPLKYLALSRV